MSTPAPGSVDRRLALLVAGALFMSNLDATVIAPAAPALARDLGVPALSVGGLVTAYVLTLAVLVPVSGWLADRYGARRVFGAAVAVFTVASAGCALAPSLAVLTATRVVQGIGGAMMVPVGRAAVLRGTAKSDLIRAVAWLTWPSLLAPVVAPALGGVLASYASWRWVFVLNLPLGVLAWAAARRLVPDVRAADAAPLDARGFALTAVGVGALVVGLTDVGSATPSAAVWAPALAAAAAVLALAARHLLRAPRPLLDLRVLRVATYRLTVASGSVFRAVITAVPFLVPLFLQLVAGWSAAAAGLALVPLFLGNVGIKPATTPLLRRFGIRGVLLGALAGSIACLAAMAAFDASTAVPVLVVVLAASGVARSIGFTAYNTVAFADVGPDRLTSANTLFSTLQELGGGLGVALGALLVRAGGLVGEGGDAYRVAFAALAAVLLVPVVAAARLPRTAGAAVTGRR
ncbi:MFS transporter [Modestobacter sp. NPDC049651]|uniref:MFS transporter n=1 Tax=unclassified Modestobacter TaxID=2643866 RepID=UPI0033D2AEAF